MDVGPGELANRVCSESPLELVCSCLVLPWQWDSRQGEDIILAILQYALPNFILLLIHEDRPGPPGAYIHSSTKRIGREVAS